MTRFGVLLAKELRVEARSREMLAGGVLLVLLVLVLANLAWSGAADARVLAPGVLWIAFAFAATLVLSRSIHRERDQGTWDTLALLPVDWGLLYLAKASAHLIVLLTIEAVALPLLALLFGLDPWRILPTLAAVLVLATVGLSAAGTLLSIASVHGRAREVLLPILLFPVLLPLLIVALDATLRAFMGQPLSSMASQLQFLAAYDIIFLAIGWLTVDYLLGD